MSDVNIDQLSGYYGFCLSTNEELDTISFEEMFGGRTTASAIATIISFVSRIWKTDLNDFIRIKSGTKTTLNELPNEKCCTSLILPLGGRSERSGIFISGHSMFYRGFYLIQQLTTDELCRFLSGSIPLLVGRLNTIQCELRRYGLPMVQESGNRTSGDKLETTDSSNTTVVAPKQKSHKRGRVPSSSCANGKGEPRQNEKGNGEAPTVRVALLKSEENDSVLHSCGETKDSEIDTKSTTRPSVGLKSPRTFTSTGSSSSTTDGGKEGERGEGGELSTKEEQSGDGKQRAKKVKISVSRGPGVILSSHQLSPMDFKQFYEALHCDNLTRVEQIEDEFERNSGRDNILYAWSALGRIGMLGTWHLYGVSEEEGKKTLLQGEKYLKKFKNSK